MLGRPRRQVPGQRRMRPVHHRRHARRRQRDTVRLDVTRIVQLWQTSTDRPEAIFLLAPARGGHFHPGGVRLHPFRPDASAPARLGFGSPTQALPLRESRKCDASSSWCCSRSPATVGRPVLPVRRAGTGPAGPVALDARSPAPAGAFGMFDPGVEPQSRRPRWRCRTVTATFTGSQSISAPSRTPAAPRRCGTLASRYVIVRRADRARHPARGRGELLHLHQPGLHAARPWTPWILRDALVPVFDTLSSRGRHERPPDRRRYRLSPGAERVGGAFHILTGSNRLQVHVAPSTRRSYLPADGRGRAVVRRRRRLARRDSRSSARDSAVAAMARTDGTLDVDRDSTRVGELDLPYTLGTRACGSAVCRQARRSRRRGSSGPGPARTATCWRSAAVGSDNTVELSFGGEFLSDLRRPNRSPIRFGVHYATLPFLLALRASSRASWRFARDRACGSRRTGAAWTSALELSLALGRASFDGAGVPALVRRGGPALSQDVPWRRQPARYLLPMAKRVYIETYGCQMNVADSELMFGVLGREGYVRADEPDDADVMLVNTCAVRDNAEQRVIGRMGELQRHKRPGDVLGVVGLHGAAPGPVAAGAGAAGGPRGRARRLPQPRPRSSAWPARDSGSATPSSARWEHYEDVPAGARERVPRAFVTVQRGCDYRCTFCIVPYTRGPERSRRLEDVVREVERAGGAAAPPRSRSWGRPSTRYHDGAARLRRPAARGRRGGRDPAGPLHQPVSHRLHRLASSRRWPSTPAVCEHVHLPVQSGSNAVLRRMLRRYTRERYLEVVARLRAAIPGHHLLHRHHRRLPGRDRGAVRRRRSRLVAEADFDDAYTFKYSVREGTPAVRLRDHVAGRGGVGAARAAHRSGAGQRAAQESRAGGRGARGAGRAAGQAGRPHAGPHPDQPSGPGRPPARVGRRVSSRPAHRHDRFHLHRRGGHAQHWRSCDPQPGRGARRSPPTTRAAALSRFLRLRDLPRGRAGLRPEPDSGPLRRHADRARWSPRSTWRRSRVARPIDVAMMEALRKVSLAPRCGPGESHRQT